MQWTEVRVLNFELATPKPIILARPLCQCLLGNLHSAFFRFLRSQAMSQKMAMAWWGVNALSPFFTIGVAGLSATMTDNVPRISGHDTQEEKEVWSRKGS